jgi:competence protein ComEC
VYRPLVCFTFGWVIGEWLANQMQLDSYWLITISFWVMGFLFYAKFMKGMPLILLIIGISTGASYFSFYHEKNISSFSHPISMNAIGQITTSPVIDGDTIRFDFAMQHLSENGKIQQISSETIRITSTAKLPHELEQIRKWQTSCYVQVPIQLERPPTAKNPGAFDYAQYLHHYGIHWLAKVSSVSQVQVLSCKTTLTSQIAQLRQSLHDRLALLYPGSSGQAGLLQAMILGEQQTLNQDTQEIFSTLGLVHVLSISGLHVSILVGSLYFLLISCGITRERVAIIILMFLPFYAILTGSSAPVVRSVIMAGMMLVAVLLRRTSDAVSFLALALLIQLLWNPYQLWEPGFQLSFLVTLGLLLYVEPLTHHLPVPGYRFRQALSVMIVSQVVSFPVIICTFYQYSWLSGPVNLFFVPVYSIVILPFSTLSLLISYLSIEWGVALATLTSWIMSGMDQLLTGISKLPHLTYSISPPALGWVLCYFFLFWFTYVTIVTDLIFVRRLKFVTLPALCFLLVIITVGAKGSMETTLITIIDVGQGDATLIETAGGKVILMDGGGTLPSRKMAWQKRKKSFEVGRDVVVPYLRYRGINHIDTMIMTHGDGDHIRGLEAVVKRFSIGEVLHSGAPPADKFESQLLSTIQKKHVPIRVVGSSDQWWMESGMHVQILHPLTTVSSGNTNNGSIVMLLSIYKTKLLFTGDMELPVEEEVLARFRLPAIDILKVAHHGSNTSSHDAWLSAVKPKQALISVGEHNRYGHPKAEVLARLRQIGAHIWRTDQQGAILVKVDQRGYQLESNER